MKIFRSFALIGVMVFICVEGKAQCVSSGARNPTVFTNDASVGTVAWTNPANVGSSNNSRATASSVVGIGSTVLTNNLVETGFGFAIPATAVICGIQVEAERRQQGVVVGGSSVKDNSVKIVKAGLAVGSDRSSAAAWPAADAYATYGGSADLWGTTWTPAEINAADFGVSYNSASLNAGLAAILLSAEIDHLRVTVFYDNVLPVELIDFSGACQNGKVDLSWTTASQTNNDYFTVERSADGLHYEQLGIIDGAGTLSQTMNYSFNDAAPIKGTSYYRLKQTDFDGTTEIFEPIAIECEKTSDPVFYPNPSSGRFNTNASGNLIIYNLLGEKVFENTVSAEEVIDISAQPHGVYFYQFSSGPSGKLLLQ